MNSASAGPAPPRRARAPAGRAPPRRPSEPSPPTTRTPKDCSSTSSRRSSSDSVAPLAGSSGTVVVEVLEVAPEHVVLQLLGDVAHPVELPVLRVEVRPWLVGAEEDAVAADATALDLGQQPARAEADGPRGVGVDLVALLAPVQELRDELDVARDAAAHVDEVDLAALAVLLHERDEVREVRVAARARVEVAHEVVLLADVEALIGDRLRLLIPRVRVGVAAEQERRLQRDDA